MRERVGKQKSFVPPPTTKNGDLQSKNKDVFPRPSSQEIDRDLSLDRSAKRPSYSITPAEKKELMRLRAIDRYGGQLSAENKARLTNL